MLSLDDLRQAMTELDDIRSSGLDVEAPAVVRGMIALQILPVLRFYKALLSPNGDKKEEDVCRTWRIVEFLAQDARGVCDRALEDSGFSEFREQIARNRKILNVLHEHAANEIRSFSTNVQNKAAEEARAFIDAKPRTAQRPSNLGGGKVVDADQIARFRLVMSRSGESMREMAPSMPSINDELMSWARDLALRH